MSNQVTLGAPDPDTLLQQMQGQAITQGWDVVHAMSVEQVNNLLAQQYVTNLANGNDLPPINGTVTIVENIFAQLVNVVLGPPLIQFSPSLDPQEAILTLNFISGSVNTVQVQDGISIILTSQTILPGDNYELTGVVSLTSVQGEVENQHNVVIDITNADNSSFTAKLGFPSGAETDLGQYFLTLLKDNPSKFSYMLGTLDYTPSGTGLTPVMFDFATQIDQNDSTDTGRLLLFIATTYNPSKGSQNFLTPGNVVPSGYSTTLIVSSRVLFQNILATDLQSNFSSAKPTITAAPISSDSNSAYCLNFTAGSLDIGDFFWTGDAVAGTLTVWTGTFDGHSFPVTADINVPLSPITIKPINNTIVASGTLQWQQLYSATLVGDDGGSSNWGPLGVNFTATVDATNSTSITTDTSSKKQQIQFSNTNISITTTYDQDNWWNKFWNAGSREQVGNYVDAHVPPKLQSAFTCQVPSVGIFAVSNLLFPGQNFFNFQEAYVPGDLVIFGQIRSTNLETAPLQVTLTDGQTQQLNALLGGITLPSNDVTWSLPAEVGSGSLEFDKTTGEIYYVAPTGITQSQTILITATTTQGNNVAQSAITLVPSGVLISPSVVIVPYGDNSGQLIAAVVAGKGTQAVNWSVSTGGGSITWDSIQASYSYTPATNAGNAPVAATITATSQASSSDQGTATVVLMDAGTTVGGVGLSPQVTSLGPSKTQSFTAENASKKLFPTVQWSLFPNVGSISAEGVYTAPSSIESPQTIVIVASIVSEFGTFAGTAIVNLLP